MAESPLPGAGDPPAGPRKRRGAPGFYCARCSWFDAPGGPPVHKVGETGDLRARLGDSAYVTSFPPESWRYVFTYETRTKRDAARLEAGVLQAARARRLGTTELLRGTAAELQALATEVARALGVPGQLRSPPPVYDPPPLPPAVGAPGEAATRLLSETDQAALRSCSLGGVEGGGEAEGLCRAFSALALGAPPARETPEGAGRPPPKARPAKPAAKRPSAKKGATSGGGEPPGAPEEDGPAEEDEPATGALFLARGFGAPLPPLEDRPYQAQAVAACLAELSLAGRAVLKMACRCGKTRVAHGVLGEYLGRPGARALFLVPSLALLHQTAAKLDAYGLRARALLVGSDATPAAFQSLTPAGGGGAAAATTDPGEIAAAVGAAGPLPLLVVSTYQSSPLLPDAFDLVVFDECHRACGDARPRPFTRVLLEFSRGARLYMTATPRYDGEVSMKDRALFGGEAYSDPLRRGIDAGYVNDFQLLLLGGGSLADQVEAAMGQADKLLVFCRSIRHATELADEVRGRGGDFACLSAHSKMKPAELEAALERFGAEGGRAVLMNCRLFQEGVEFPALNGVFFAAPRHTPRDIIQSLCRPLNRRPGKPPSRIFLPVAYDPHFAPQAPENLGRFVSVVPVFDALMAEDPLLYEHLLDPAGTAYPLGWVDSAARGADDGRLGLRYTPAQVLAGVRLAVRRGSAAPRAGERLLRAAKIPWEIGSAELRRIVTECRRYPKTTDAFVYGEARVNYGAYYDYLRKAYRRREAGEDCPLEPYQLRFLEALPGWQTYGVHGPYPWEETLATLEKWLGASGGVPPMVDINCGGWVGLDATPLERLSGTLTCINQSDGRDRQADGAPAPGSGFTLAADKQKDLDELCARWGLRWRKERRPAPEGAPAGSPGSLLEDAKGAYTGKRTFIQQAFDRFKAHVKRHGAEDPYVQEHFPGWPLKHKRQELPEVWARRKEVCPPRWRPRA